ncbi:hypothetical protein M2152_001402 [Microbacteriaceae bacterium SG_E_30_P1]|uniref:SbsA Ig-like domain-containing protein n=1 Tax=Antiquaquibacter oligotrophicus TaxID=2880260 RepID=A0ABT6KMI8_9MICO|nr:hypothetical protein [Antiquaquibacter oligotrophicus]MDH6181220.1 hypothetical protein [Antiquaquibacter oligotrophicus]UDF13085.1 hypothetical protein LH407_13125 [Antiquaquibacter oligotrophicus]
MSPTSSDPETRSPFRRVFLAVVGALVLLCGVFLAIAYLQGPKLSDAQIDLVSAIAQPDQQLRLFLNQQIDDIDPDQITVTPATAVSVSTSGDLVAVQFDTPLRYDTEYTVRIDGVRSAALPQSSTVEHRFTTGAPSPLYLDRGTPNDAIVRVGLKGSEREVIFETPGIGAFAATGQVLVVSTVDAEGISRLMLVSLADGAVEELRLPEEGTVTDLAVSDAGPIIAFTFTPSAPVDGEVFGGRRVLAMNLEQGRTLFTVGELGGEVFPISSWRFVPGARSMVVQGTEDTTFLLDAAPEAVPVPIGRFTDILGISRDGSTMSASDALGGVLVSLEDGETERFEPSLIEGSSPFLGEVEVLPDGDVIEKAALQTTEGRFLVVMAVDDGETGRVLYQTPAQAGSIENFRVSPNGQFVAVEVVPVIADAVSDGYLVDQRSTTITTVIVEIETGLIVRSVEGFGLLW